jgi:hypothetical protein
MLDERAIAVALRKERLLARCEGQRAAMAESYRRWQAPARIIDRGWAAAQFLRTHPAVLAVGVAAALVMGRRNVFTWVGRGLVAWRAWRSLAGWLRRFSA